MTLARRDSYLVVPRSVQELPKFCVKCGEHAANRIHKTYFWHPAIYYVLYLICFPFGYVFVTSTLSQKMPLSVFLCERHAERRQLFFVLALLPFLALPIGTFIIGGDRGKEVGGAGFLAGLVLLVIANYLIRPVGMTEDEATYTGVGEDFLRRISR